MSSTAGVLCGGSFARPGSVVAWSTIGLTLIFFYMLGLRGLRLIVATVVMWFPVLIVSTFLLDHIVPPRLEAYKPKDGSGSTLFLR